MQNKSTIKNQKGPGFLWLLTMAWRDARNNKSRLFLFVSSIILGIAALVAVYSFKDNLQKDIDEQAKVLTGADLIVESRTPVNPKVEHVLDTLGSEKASERSFASMLYFLKGSASRLVQVKALEGNYPFYGSFETTPRSAATVFQTGRGALVDKTVMLQYNAKPGDSIKIGALNFKIEGSLDKAPGQSGLSSTVAPIVYIPLQYLASTGLTKIGSRIQYKYFYKFDQTEELGRTLKQLKPFFEKEDLDIETVESRKESTGRSFKDVNRFLALSGFISLLLGCIGVGSSVQVYVKEKLGAIATLRCLGMKASDAFLIYLIQIVFMGFIGALLGAILGTLLQFALPVVLKDFLPVELSMEISWSAVTQGILLGMVISILFALPSLLSVRKVSPLNAIRQSFQEEKGKQDPLVWVAYILMGAFVLLFTRLQMNNWMEAGAFTLGIGIAFLALFGLSNLLMWSVKKIIPTSLSYLYRQGFANLHRPNNQTFMLTVSIGLSTAFICTLFFVQGMLIKRVTLSSGKNQANMVLFDIQNTQQKAVSNLARSFGLPVLSEVPVITVRIDKINGKSLSDLPKSDSLPNSKKKNNGPSERAFRGELRVTFQDTLTSAEKITNGIWTGKVLPEQPIPISLEEGYARGINVHIGDSIVFNVQGLLISTVVGSFREVNWTRMQTNFRIVFPTGVLEDAPQFHVLMTRVPGSNVSAKFQGSVVKSFPNVSVIDLDLILKVLEDLLSKISFVIQFMAAFSMATGWVVLISTIRTSRGQRLKENVLLRTLGASRSQIIKITAVEYTFLGALAAGAGILLAMIGSWTLAVFAFDTSFVPPFLPILLLFVLIVMIIVLTGVLSSRKAFDAPPLAVLKE
ncbi:ABC transporter permease [Pedobacter sp. JCM 36344]|uniref:ABC transporter permease n=1 Tax=Pedobacter sp. JCM 36344 TaxID=3374280 RepID=UPI00397DFE7D